MNGTERRLLADNFMCSFNMSGHKRLRCCEMRIAPRIIDKRLLHKHSELASGSFDPKRGLHLSQRTSRGSAMIKSILLAVGVAVFTSAASAATIAGDTFTMTGNIDNYFVDFPAVSGVALGTTGAGSCLYYDTSGKCDAVSEVPTVGDPNVLTVDFISNSAFEIGLNGRNMTGGSYPVEILISGLDFINGPLTAAITGVTFNLHGGDLAGYLASPTNLGGASWSDPAISFTANSITIRWDNFEGQLLGDGPRIAFDVTTSGTSPTPVPLPASAPFLLAGLAALGLRRMRHHPRAVRRVCAAAWRGLSG